MSAPTKAQIRDVLDIVMQHFGDLEDMSAAADAMLDAGSSMSARQDALDHYEITADDFAAAIADELRR